MVYCVDVAVNEHTHDVGLQLYTGDQKIFKAYVFVKVKGVCCVRFTYDMFLIENGQAVIRVVS